MCCTMGHTCDCRPQTPTEDVICGECHISIPRTPNWDGLCRSCKRDRERDA